MKSKTRLGLFILSVGLALWVYARTDAVAASPAGTPSPSLDLATAELEAIEHSPDYQKAINAEKEASWEQVEAFTAGSPSHLSIGGKYFFDNQYPQTCCVRSRWSPALPGEFPIADLSLDATFDLFDGFGTSTSWTRRTTRMNPPASCNGLPYNSQHVRLAYYKAHAAQELSDMADQNVKTLEDHLRIVNGPMENGQATKYDVLRVKVQLSRGPIGPDLRPRQCGPGPGKAFPGHGSYPRTAAV